MVTGPLQYLAGHPVPDRLFGEACFPGRDERLQFYLGRVAANDQ